MDFRKTFDQIPEEFDKYRPRYREEVFLELMSLCKLDSDKKVLEIGPGTGQATEPILKTGCDYTAIELGENFVSFLMIFENLLYVLLVSHSNLHRMCKVPLYFENS